MFSLSLSLSLSLQRHWCPASLLFDGNRETFTPEKKRLDHDIYHSRQSNAGFKNEWRHTSTSSISLDGIHKDNF